MTSTVYRFLSAGVLAMWSAALCFLYFTDRIASYLHPYFHPLVAACGVVLFLLAIVIIIAPSTVTVGCAAPSLSTLGGIAGCAVLIIPLLAALIFSKDAFGMSTVINRTYVEDVSQLPGAPVTPPTETPPVEPALPGDTSTPQADNTTPDIPRNSKGDIVAEVVDLLYATQDPEMRKTFENQSVEVLGQLIPAKINNPKGDRYDVVRLFMTCCAADARPVAITLHPTSKITLKEMSWVKVRGKVMFPIVGGQSRPLLEDATVTPTEPPEEAFIY